MLDQIMQQFGYVAGELSSDAYFPYIDHIAPTVMLLADNAVMSVMRMPGAPFALVMNSQRNAHKRRLTAFLNAIAFVITSVAARRADMSSFTEEGIPLAYPWCCSRMY